MQMTSRPSGPASNDRTTQGAPLLAFGSRDPDDIAFFPRSGKVSLRGIGLRFRVDRLDYWDGEPD
jgi:hypothetical protein